MSGTTKQRRTIPCANSHLSPPSAQSRPLTPEGVPLWFHGLLARSVAEDLLLKSPQSAVGLFLVRQSSNRGGHFVISVSTGMSVNHYLVDTLESMFYVRRDRSEDRGRDIQARDLHSLVQCYQGSQLDESGLILKDGLLRTTSITVTAPLTAMTYSKSNHNYIPLHMDNREYIALDDFTAGDDLQALSFRRGEVLTVLQKESKNWWFAYNVGHDLGYIPASLVCNLKEWQQQKCKSAGAGGGFCNLGCLDADAVFVSDREETDEGVRRRRRDEKKCLLDVNSNILGLCGGCSRSSLPPSPVRSGGTSPSTAKDVEYARRDNVSSDYITMCLRHREHQKLCQIQRLFDARLAQQLSCSLRPGEPIAQSVNSKSDLKPSATHRCRTAETGDVCSSASPSPTRRMESRLISKETIPCLLVGSIPANDATFQSDCHIGSNGGVEAVSLPRVSQIPEVKLPPCVEERADGKQATPSVSVDKWVKAKSPWDLAGDNSYDPMAMYLRLAECTTGPQTGS